MNYDLIYEYLKAYCYSKFSYSVTTSNIYDKLSQEERHVVSCINTTDRYEIVLKCHKHGASTAEYYINLYLTLK